MIPTKKWRHCLATCHLSVMPSQRPCNGGTCWRLGFMVWMVSFSWMSATNAWGKLKSAGVETAMDFGPVKSWEADVSWRFVRNDCWRWCFFHVKSWSVGHWKCENSCLLFVSPRSLNNLWGDLLILVRECKRYIYIVQIVQSVDIRMESLFWNVELITSSNKLSNVETMWVFPGFRWDLDRWFWSATPWRLWNSCRCSGINHEHWWNLFN